MKTPKRKSKFKFCPVGLEYGHPEKTPTRAAEERTRWKRKNRIKQLKRTIERLSKENFLMKIDLHIPTNISYEEYHARRVDFTEKKPEPEYYD